MSQIIQMLQKGIDTEKGLLIRSVTEMLSQKSPDDLTPMELDLMSLIKFEYLDDAMKLDLAKRLSKIDLLSAGISNPKTAKDAGLENLSNWILHLSPSDLSGVNVCPSASAGCRAACLNGAGRGLFDGVQLPRLRKTLYFAKFRNEFLKHLDAEIAWITKKETGKTIIVRLNGTSDISWEMFKIRDAKNIFDLYPQITFYDYTKVATRLARIAKIKNYHVTFSCNESNWTECLKALALGINVATVFRTSELPEKYEGFEVINGDIHDFRFLDVRKPIGVIVGLKAKGPAKKDVSGFVKDVA